MQVGIIMTLGGGEVEGMMLRSIVFTMGYFHRYKLFHRVLKLIEHKSWYIAAVHV